MNRRLLTLTLADLTVGLLGSCSKINERIDGLDQRIDSIENEKIASIEGQIAVINQSIADLGAIRNNINELQTAVGAKGEDISELQAADVALGKRIDVLEAYAGELSKYAQKDWVNEIFATVEQLNATKTELSTLEETVKKLGETFDGKLSDLKTELTSSITSAINGISASISALEARVSTLEKMIQTVSIISAYSDGSVQAVGGSLTIDCIISPKEAVGSLKKENFAVLINEVLTKGASVDTIRITRDEDLVIDKEEGTATIRVDVLSKLPSNGKALTVALNVKNGISDFTTKFVGVTVVEAPIPVADLVVKGKIFTSVKNDKRGIDVVEAFAVKDGKFIYVGNKDGATPYIKEGTTQVVDYQGLVIPGCTEGHGHFIGIDGITRLLPGFKKSYKELVTTIVPEKMKTNPGPFVSFGWNTPDVTKICAVNYADAIEKVSNGYPVILMDSSGHNALCNTTALKNAGLINDKGEKIKDVRGGDIVTVLDAQSSPTQIASGYVTDEVVMYVVEKNNVAPLLNEAGYLTACQNSVEELNKRGFTSYMDAYINGLDDGEAYKYLAQMDEDGTLTANVMGYYTIRSYDWGVPKGGNMPQQVTEKLARINELSNKYTKGHIQANGVKMFADGVVETYTGWISEEYTVPGLPEEKKHGNKIWEQDEANAIVAAANAKGMPVHVHTFGDLACNQVITAFCASPSASSLKIRNSLAHVRNISDADITRCGENNIGIASNLIWHAGDPTEIRRYFFSIMPEKVYEDGYPMKKLLNAGIMVSSSTDAPCDETITGNVPNIIGVTVTGLYPDFLSANPLGPNDLLTVSEALQCLTINGAASLGLEKERGSIEVGKYADFVVLDNDILELEKTNKNGIFNTNVANTWFEGRKVYPRN